MTATQAAPVVAERPLARRVRWLFVRGLACVVAGTLVLGLGGRLVMLLSRLLHPDTVGRLTEGGNRIGEVTLGGTLGLIVFGGLLGGVLAGVVWAILATWLPGRWWVVGLGAVLLGGPFLIDGDNVDFVILDPPGIDVALLLGLLFVFGVAVHVLDRVFDARVAATSSNLVIGIRASAVALGAAMLVPTFGFYFLRSFCFCAHPPWLTGAALLVAAGASLWWWVDDLSGAAAPRTAQTWMGRIGLTVAVLSSSVDLTTELLLVL